MKEFREFAMKGNVIDLAVGVIIGAAFGRLVDSLVKDLIMPVNGRVIGGLDFSNWFIRLGESAARLQRADGLRRTHQGRCAALPTAISSPWRSISLILAFIIFLMVKEINALKRTHAPPPPPPEQIELLREIRDALTKR